MSLKLFVVGMPKSGTSTLQNALVRSGLKSAHWKDPTAGFVGPSLYRRHFRGEDPLLDFQGFDAVTQADVTINGANYWPQMDFSMLSSIEKYHPECVFVLNFRVPEKTADSMIRWTDYSDRLSANDIPGLPRGYGSNARDLARWISGHYRAVRRFFDGKDNFFEYDISDPEAPELIGKRLGVTIRWWGISNKNDQNNAVTRAWAERETS